MANLTDNGAPFVPKDNEDDGFKPLPEGDYVCVVSSSEKKPTKRNTGDLLKLSIDVIEGPHKGRKLFCNLNLWNTNPEAVRISRGELARLCSAVGKGPIQDSSELHNLPFVAKVKVVPRHDDPDELQNEIKSFASCTATAAPTPAQGSQPAWKAA